MALRAVEGKQSRWLRFVRVIASLIILDADKRRVLRNAERHPESEEALGKSLFSKLH